MSTLTDEQLFDMSDEELEAAFREAKAELNSPDTSFEEEYVENDIANQEAEEYMEYPDDQDSDDDASLDDEEDEEFEDESEDEEGELDGEPETDDEETDDEEEESEETEQPVQDEVLTFKANGQEYQFTTSEMKSQFGKVFGQAMDYTKKMQQIKPWRKTIDAIESANLSDSDVNLMIDVLKGDKDAIAEVLKRTGTDALDLDTENTNYIAKDYGRNETELAIKDIVEEISNDKEYTLTHNVLEKQWDNKSRNAFIEDPNMIKLLHTDIKSGMFDTLNPIAQKLKVYDSARQSDLDYYKLAAQQYFNQQAQEETRQRADYDAQVTREEAQQRRLEEANAKQAKQTATKQASAKRKAAAPSKKSAGTKKAIDYLDDSDEAFEDWYSKLQEAQ